MVYTAPFPWKDGNLSSSYVPPSFCINRGHDVTISSADDDEAELALPKLKTRSNFGGLGDFAESTATLLFWDDYARTEGLRRYITPSAIRTTETLIGRVTYGYIAPDVGNCLFERLLVRRLSGYPEGGRRLSRTSRS